MGKSQSSIGEHGLWPTSLKNLSELASGEGFGEYFWNQFNGNEAPYLRWKEVFDVLEIEGEGNLLHCEGVVGAAGAEDHEVGRFSEAQGVGEAVH